MPLKNLFFLAFAGYALAQDATNGTIPTLEAALTSTASLSALAGVLRLYPDLLGTLGSAQNITILAPSNDAFGEIDNATLTSLTGNEGLITAVLQYHVLAGSYPASAVTNVSAFIPTLLDNPLFTNVTNGQVVEAVLSDGNVTFFSGLLSNTSVSTAVRMRRLHQYPFLITKYHRTSISLAASSTLLTTFLSFPKLPPTPCLQQV